MWLLVLLLSRRKVDEENHALANTTEIVFLCGFFVFESDLRYILSVWLHQNTEPPAEIGSAEIRRRRSTEVGHHES